MLGQNRDNNMWLVIRYENEKLAKQHMLAETMLESSKTRTNKTKPSGRQALQM